MAIMVPNELPAAHKGPRYSENILWKQLKDQLSDEFVVYHGLPYLTDEARQGEVDFLIMHPEHGVLNLECKGSGVHRRPNGRWVRRNPDGSFDKMSRTPTEQARDQIESIVEVLSDHIQEVLGYFPGKFPVLYGWALAFPRTRLGGINPPPSLAREVLLSAEEMDSLEESIIEAYDFHARKMKGARRTWDEETFEKIRFNVMQAPVRLEPNLGGTIELERQKFIELSDNQLEIIRSLLVNNRLRVCGGAGTGKTLMAMHGARLLADQGKKVLVTCFNSGLAEHLREVRDDGPATGGSIDIDNFHAICVEAARSIGRDLKFPPRDAPRQEQRRFWAETAPFPLLEALNNPDYERGPWDAIIVDEAQDFHHEWWDILKAGLREQPETGQPGKLLVFDDARQSIFDHGSEVPDFPANFRLHENYRNTKAICQPVAQLGGIDLRPHRDAPAGETPSVYQQRGPTKTRRKVGELLREHIVGEKVAPRDIAILTPHTPANSSLEAAEELGEQPIVHDTDAWLAGEGVLHTTISAFKGMQAGVVILVDVDPEDERCDVNARYVAASRAQHRLHVLQKGHWLER